MTTLADLVGKIPRVVHVAPNVTVRDAAKVMATANVGCAAVIEDGSLVGIFTERDILKKVLLNDLLTDKVTVAEVMTRDIVSGRLDMSARDARILLKQHHIRHLPVLSESSDLVGVLSIRDLVLDEVQELRDYIALSEG